MRKEETMSCKWTRSIPGLVGVMSSVLFASQLSAAADSRRAHVPNVAGKMLIRLARELRQQVINPMTELSGNFPHR